MSSVAKTGVGAEQPTNKLSIGNVLFVRNMLQLPFHSQTLPQVWLVSAAVLVFENMPYISILTQVWLVSIAVPVFSHESVACMNISPQVWVVSVAVLVCESVPCMSISTVVIDIV